MPFFKRKVQESKVETPSDNSNVPSEQEIQDADVELPEEEGVENREQENSQAETQQAVQPKKEENKPQQKQLDITLKDYLVELELRITAIESRLFRSGI